MRLPESTLLTLLLMRLREKSESLASSPPELSSSLERPCCGVACLKALRLRLLPADCGLNLLDAPESVALVPERTEGWYDRDGGAGRPEAGFETFLTGIWTVFLTTVFLGPVEALLKKFMLRAVQ